MQNLSQLQYLRIFEQFPEDKDLICSIIKLNLNKKDKTEVKWLFEIAKKYLDKEKSKELDTELYNLLSPGDYFYFWENRLVSILPKQYLCSLLKEDKITTDSLKEWLEHKVIAPDTLADFLLENLNQGETVTNRIIFTRYSNIIAFLLELDPAYATDIKNIKNDFYNAVLWSQGKSEVFNFEIIKHKFIYFTPEEQVRILRRLFWLKSTGEFDLTVSHLEEILRFDLDLFKATHQLNPEVPIDISTEVVIQALVNYKEKGKFLVESDLLKVVLGGIANNRKMRFKLSEYFERCSGRMIGEFDWKRNGEVKKIKFGENDFYYALEFGYQSDLVEKVRMLPGRNWNGEAKHWGVPSKYEKEVLQFARENRFFINIEGNAEANNPHLAVFKRSEVPEGISFCDGRKANKVHYRYNKEFWWCAGQSCFQKCETLHPQEEWENYTLLDFCELLELDTDEVNHMNDFVSKGRYYQFISLVNRFNRLLTKLYCHECNEILFPVQAGHFAAYNVVRFSCQNSRCREYEQVIYLNHCLNGQCNSIIDSRISSRCTHELFICNSCGCCCSHNMLERRLNNLELTGGYIHPELRERVDKKLGHLERAEYFCYKCSKEMEEVRPDEFTCNEYHVNYETSRFKFSRPHKHLPKA